jgi:hypothetical protein
VGGASDTLVCAGKEAQPRVESRMLSRAGPQGSRHLGSGGQVTDVGLP